jgi:hypothetical protein
MGQMTAISRGTPSTALEAAESFLLASQNADGGWGYAPGQASTVEATAAVVMASQGDASLAEARDRALQWLRGAQHRDGGWGLNAGDPESGWETAWAVLALAGAADGDAARRGADWLLAVEPQEFEDAMLAEAREVLAIDVSLTGWPWLPGQASWVEPTALALLALSVLPEADAPAARLDEAVRYLTDRRCAGGGWNFGNPVMLGASLPPRAHPTAWALMALTRLRRDVIRPEDITALRAEMASDGGALALGLGALALRGLGEDDAGAASRLLALQAADGSWNENPYHTAIAMMALRGSL